MDNFEDLKNQAPSRTETGDWDYGYDWRLAAFFLGLIFIPLGISFQLKMETVVIGLFFLVPGALALVFSVRSFYREYRQQQRIIVDKIQSITAEDTSDKVTD